MARVPMWGLVASAAAPMFLIGGSTVAARLQPPGYDPVTHNLSELAGLDASQRWVMTLALLAHSGCQIATSLALRPAAPPGRMLLAAGGICTVLVGLNPLPSSHRGSTVHAVFAAGAFGALAMSPLASWRRGSSVPWGLRPAVAVTAGCGLLALTGWFFGEVVSGGSHAGLAERVAAASQALWPCAVAISARWA